MISRLVEMLNWALHLLGVRVASSLHGGESDGEDGGEEGEGARRRKMEVGVETAKCEGESSGVGVCTATESGAHSSSCRCSCSCRERCSRLATEVKGLTALRECFLCLRRDNV